MLLNQDHLAVSYPTTLHVPLGLDLSFFLWVLCILTCSTGTIMMKGIAYINQIYPKFQMIKPNLALIITVT